MFYFIFILLLLLSCLFKMQSFLIKPSNYILDIVHEVNQCQEFGTYKQDDLFLRLLMSVLNQVRTESLSYKGIRQSTLCTFGLTINSHWQKRNEVV